MSNAVAVQTAGASALAAFQVPDDIKQELALHGGNIAERATTNSLMFGNGAWTMSVNGAKKVLQRKNEDGDLENVQMLRVIVLGYNQVRERSYYDGPYDSGNQRAPDCWAKDGRRPHIDVAEPQSKTCELCPKAAKGSNPITGGAACSQHRILVVVPAGDLDAPALRLKIAVTSDWDLQDEQARAQGWYGFNNYTDFLRQNGATHTGAMITRMRFDPNPKVTYSKIQFARGDFLAADDRAKMYARAKSDEVMDLLNQTWGPPKAATGKALPQDDAPAGDPVFSQSGAAAQAAQARIKAAEAADEAGALRRKQEQDAAIARAEQAKHDAEVAAKAVADKKAAAIAAAKALLAEAEAEAAGFDDPKPAVVSVAPAAAAPVVTDTAAPAKRTRRATTAPEVPSAPVEVPESISGLMDAWS